MSNFHDDLGTMPTRPYSWKKNDGGQRAGSDMMAASVLALPSGQWQPATVMAASVLACPLQP